MYNTSTVSHSRVGKQRSKVSNTAAIIVFAVLLGLVTIIVLWSLWKKTIKNRRTNAINTSLGSPGDSSSPRV